MKVLKNKKSIAFLSIAALLVAFFAIYPVKKSISDNTPGGGTATSDCWTILVWQSVTGNWCQHIIKSCEGCDPPWIVGNGVEVDCYTWDTSQMRSPEELDDFIQSMYPDIPITKVKNKPTELTRAQ